MKSRFAIGTICACLLGVVWVGGQALHTENEFVTISESIDPVVTDASAIANDAIDMRGFLVMANEAAEHREPRRVTEDEFLRMSQEPNTVILDARSRDMFEMLHVEGAVNLPFPDITVASLEQLLPDKSTRILIYCNNNFRNEERAMPSKIAPASLNLSTYVSLYTYGYRNVYELGPRRDARESILPFVSTLPEYQPDQFNPSENQ